MSHYSDHLTWQKLDCPPEVYTWSVSHQHFFDLRMVALRLNDQSLAIYSPIALKDLAPMHELRKLGTVRALIAPNHFHNLGLKPWLKEFPSAQLYAAQAAIPRLTKVLGLNFSEISKLHEFMPQGLQLVVPEGLKTGEIWGLIGAGSPQPVLVVSDSFFNMNPKSGLFGLMLKLGGSVPGLKQTRVFRLLAIKQRQLYRDSARAYLEALRPKVLVPSHGAILTDSNLTERLKALL